jgi:2-polyprenyl-6-methoxyphenol hydroxylase-like FAD-dependent oxidoreductase
MTSCDVLVVGGGPAGSTLAAFLARAGVSVHLLERDSFPRYHIGESLIPQVLDVLEESGALAAVEAHGFLRKEGGVFRWGRKETPWSFYFDEARSRYRHTYAYQVIRSEFDQLLLNHARNCGATIEEKVSAEELNVEDASHLSNGVTVTATNSSGEAREYQ